MSSLFNWNSTDAGATTTSDFDIPSIAVNMLSTFDPLVDWLPKSSIWKKYLPTWHLVKSYSKHICEESWYDENLGIYDWYCKYCGKMML